jgi:hypothetical protein
MNQPIAGVPPPTTPPTKKSLDAVTMVFMFTLLCVVGLVVMTLWLRMRSSRRRLAALIGVGAEGERPGAGARLVVDPWEESARRLEVEKSVDDDDTVDLDPGSLGPEDIEPGDEPRNGKGAQ